MWITFNPFHMHDLASILLVFLMSVQPDKCWHLQHNEVT